MRRDVFLKNESLKQDQNLHFKPFSALWHFKLSDIVAQLACLRFVPPDVRSGVTRFPESKFRIRNRRQNKQQNRILSVSLFDMN